MRIISLVPSWTETLIESGVYPVGRTRFCIHPNTSVQNIPIVGGTKTVNWDLIRELKPDLLILDKEENPLDFSRQGLPFWSSHVTNGLSLEHDLKELAGILQNKELLRWAGICEQINQSKSLSKPFLESDAIIEELTKNSIFNPQPDIQSNIQPSARANPLAYMIWKNPWMSVSKETYIGFVLEKLGFEVFNWEHSKSKYPEVDIDPTKKINYFFSSEPFPFGKKKDEILKVKFHPESRLFLVDGELFSWFGARSLKFMKKALQISDPK